jgi:low affinity Fe/Cu permease
MAQKRSKTPAAAGNSNSSPSADRAEHSSAAQRPHNHQDRGNNQIRNNSSQNHNGLNHLFSELACKTAHFAGKPLAFLVAVLVVVIWGLTGPMFGYSDTWQLVINTSTTIITFLMVFLIQHTQNRDTMAVQLKLSELIIAVRGAENRLAAAEDMTEEELEQLHQEYRQCADATLDHLQKRRGGKLQQAS